MSSEGLKQIIGEIAQNPKTAIAVSTGTVGAGTGTALEKLPAMLGIIASSMGILLTTTLLVIHITRWRLQRVQLQLEINDLQAREAERAAMAAQSPCRRADDPIQPKDY